MITNDLAPAGLSTGDTVTWNPDGTQHPLGTVTGLIFDYEAFATVQGGINAVTVGGTVYVEAGTYTENVVLNKSATLSGAQVNVDAMILNARMIRCDTIIANTVMGSSYTPGAGNIW